MKQYIGNGMLLITAIFWGSGFAVTAFALEYLTAYQVMAGRFALATLILTILFGYKFKSFTKPIVWKGAFLGILLYIAFVLKTVGLRYTTATKVAIILSTESFLECCCQLYSYVKY